MSNLKQDFFDALRGISLSRLVYFNLFLLSALILSTRLATFLHEVLGHGLAAAAMGGEVNGIRISLFGGGNAYYQFHTQIGNAGAFAVAFGGIAVNLVTGALAIWLVNKAGSHRAWAVFLSLFGIVSLSGGLSYASLGFYYGVGDPVAWMKDLSGVSRWDWLSFLVPMPFSCYFALRSFFRSIQPWFPVRRFIGKAVVLAMTLGLTLCAYSCLYLYTGQRSVAVEIPAIAHVRAVESIRQEKKALIRKRLHEAFPELSQEDLSRMLERVPIEVRPEEIPSKPSLIPVLVSAQIAGVLLMLFARERSPLPAPRLSSRLILGNAFLAAAVIAALIATGGWIWTGHQTGYPKKSFSLTSARV